jgi:cell division septum initiation protein DivIVA
VAIDVEGRGAEDTSAAREAQLRKDADLLKQQYTKRIDDLLQNMSRLEAEVVTLNKEKAQMNRVAKNDEERAAMRIFSLRNEVQEAKKQHQHDLSSAYIDIFTQIAN